MTSHDVVAAPQMRTKDECAHLLRCSRATIDNRIRAYDEAIAKGATPPAGALRSTKWFGRRLIADAWIRDALGIDAQLEPMPPRKKLAPRGRAFQRHTE